MSIEDEMTAHWFDDPDFQRVMRRRDFLCRNPPQCHRCETEQVQLKHMDVPAEWKCRKCKLVFWDEPMAAAGQTSQARE